MITYTEIVEQIGSLSTSSSCAFLLSSLIVYNALVKLKVISTQHYINNMKLCIIIAHAPITPDRNVYIALSCYDYNTNTHSWFEPTVTL